MLEYLAVAISLLFSPPSPPLGAREREIIMDTRSLAIRASWKRSRITTEETPKRRSSKLSAFFLAASNYVMTLGRNDTFASPMSARRTRARVPCGPPAIIFGRVSAAVPSPASLLLALQKETERRTDGRLNNGDFEDLRFHSVCVCTRYTRRVKLDINRHTGWGSRARAR